MFYSAQQKLPACDYVSIVKSLYADRRSMLYGTLAAAMAAGLSGLRSGYAPLGFIALAFVVVAFGRYLDMKAFTRADLRAEDADTAARWELRATIGGVTVAAAHGLWCLVSFTAGDDGFAAFAATSVTIAGVVGIATRNFAVDRLVTLQAIFVAVPLAVGLLLKGDLYHGLLAVLLLVFISSLRRLSTGIREILLREVHGRVEANRLALEMDTALATMPHGLCMLDGAGRVAVVNSRVQQMLPCLVAHRSLGRSLGKVVAAGRSDGLMGDALAKALEEVLAGGLIHEKTVVPVDGRQLEITVTSREGHTVLMFEDITERVLANERISFMARFDGLTGLSNRGYFSEQVQSELARRCEESSGESAMMMMVDIDDFKHVNDTFGHLAGDQLLIEAAQRIRAIVEPLGMVSRFGGDEFTVFFGQGVTASMAERHALSILDALQTPFPVGGRLHKANASVGVVIAPPSEDLATILTRADLALYQAKGNGKAQWALFHDRMDTEYRHRQRLKTDLREAISNDELSLVYQPIVNIADRRIVGCEALARWHHRELGPIPPTVFIALAEEIGAISDISRWVLRTATRECAAWPEPLRVSVNLSATDFRMTSVSGMVRTALAESGLLPSRLEVEITESTLIEENEAVVEALGDLRQHGVGIALDDFGTGYSSLSYLHALPFTHLKIDRSFVVDVASNARSLKLLTNIARLSKDMAMKVTVEGIETEEQLSAVAACMNVDQAQGYLFGLPLPRREVADLIACIGAPESKVRRQA